MAKKAMPRKRLSGKAHQKRAARKRRGRVRSVRRSRFADLTFWVPPEPEEQATLRQSAELEGGSESSDMASLAKARPEIGVSDGNVAAQKRGKELYPVTAPALWNIHLSAGCPYCLAVASGGLPIDRWPEPCLCRVSIGQGQITDVRCRDSVAAQTIRHHWSCPYWDHSEEVPF